MAKGVSYRIKNIDSVFNAIKSIYSEVTQQSSELEKIAKFAKDRIVAETRKGNDLTNDGVKQPELSEGYIAFRRGVVSKRKIEAHKASRRDFENAARISGKNKIVPDPTFFRTNKSNLTLTGQLLNSIEYKIEEREKKIIITPTGSRDDGKTNLEVAEELAKRRSRLAPRGRKFLGLDERGFKRIRNLIIEAIRRVALKKGY